jgi:AcrR family transcriptional regulator
MATLPEHLKAVPVGRDPLPREVLAEHQRERILVAATTVFAKRGYQGTTVDRLVAAARIGVGSFYDIFENKEDCFLQAHDRVIVQARQEIFAAIPSDRPWIEQVCLALRAMLTWVAANPSPARLVLVETQTAGAAGLSRYEELLNSFIAPLREGRDGTPLAAELPATLEQAIVAGIAWLLSQRIVVGKIDDIEELFPDLARVALEPYRGETEVNDLISAQKVSSLAGSTV